MPQLGILFDIQKLGNGFYGYSCFRILFSVLKASELAACTLSHGVLERDGRRIYCVSIESVRLRSLMTMRHRLSASVARGLMPLDSRFVEEDDLYGDELALAASVSETGELMNCQSRWILEVWQRSQVALAPSPSPLPVEPQAVAVAVARPVVTAAAARNDARIPDRVPFPLWWSLHGRRAFAWLASCCLGGALLPLFGAGVAACIALALAGVLQGLTMQWRLRTERNLSGPAIVEEAAKLISNRTATEICQRLQRPGAQSSPLLRAFQAITRHWAATHDAAGATAILEHHRQAEEHILRADLEELRFISWGVPALALCSFFGMQVFVGVPESWMEAPKLALIGASGWLAVEALRSAVRSTADRLYGEIARLTLGFWLPAIEQAMPPEPGDRQRAIQATA